MLLGALVLLLMLIVVAALLVVATIIASAFALLRPPRMTDGKAAWVLKRLSPGDLGMRFEELRFIVRDERDGKRIPIAAWWIPHPNANGRCVVMIHGYADAKVGALAWGPTWHALGYNICAIDLRAHGNSGGAYTTGGFYERHDLDQIINELRASRPNDTRRVALFGVSLGAAVALATAATRDDIDVLVLESPFIDYRRPVTEHAKLLGMPLTSLAPAAIRVAQWISGANFDAVRSIDLLARVPAPVMVIHAEHDLFAPEEDARRMEAALRDRAARGLVSSYWRVPGTSHAMCIVADPDEYRDRIAAFLKNAPADDRQAEQNQITRVE